MLANSVVGTSHERIGERCQDYATARLVEAGEVSSLILVCADGAGSASRAEAGAKLACHEFLSVAASALTGGLSVSAITFEIARDWCDRARRRLSLEACVCGAELRDFSCTLLAAVVSDRHAVFMQIGDGAIVYREGDGYRTAFWPENGEYANVTYFLTGPDFESRLNVKLLEFGPDEVALFTDGLQPLALHYATKTVHAPFFDPMFATLRREPDPDTLRAPLKQFLASKPVVERTDDDKTLILATRRLPEHDHAPPRQ
ncbi:Serine/threonine protein phosphatase [Fimbriiglobus ruber]|uniref:Serine/threonine protein phosphatase n=1 Tax=Fimbriiglobus ruber TaxID=1908690 RepID=A0A225DFF0_9BACT|nr:Serine/threonine protein phosphatase [Fimbriiglobus ruber]